MDNQTQKTVERLTKQYVAKMQRIAKLEEELATIKAEVATLAPQGAKTPHGTWQVYSESTRQAYTTSDVSKLVEKLVLEGNEVAIRILELRKDSTVQGGMRFIKAKPQE